MVNSWLKPLTAVLVLIVQIAACSEVPSSTVTQIAPISTASPTAPPATPPPTASPATQSPSPVAPTAKPATFSVAELVVDKTEVASGQTVTVTAKISNSGEVEGRYTAELTVDGKKTDAKEVTISPRGTEAVTFGFTSSEVGSHQIAVGTSRKAVTVFETRQYLLRRDRGELSYNWSVYDPRGQWTRFTPPVTPFTIRNVQVRGRRNEFNDPDKKKYTIKIWDKGFSKELFSADYPYSKFSTGYAMVDNEIEPGVVVNDDFYVDFISRSEQPASGQQPTVVIYLTIDYTVGGEQYSGYSYSGTIDSSQLASKIVQDPRFASSSWVIQVQGTGRSADLTPTPAPPKSSITARPTQAAPSPTISASEMLNTLKKSMVRIKTDSGSGSGQVILSDGYVLTANHVIEGATSVKVVMPDGTELAGKTLGRDEMRDIALIKVSAENLKAVSVGKSGDLKVGDEVYVVGFPLDLKGDATVSKGIVSANRKDKDTGVTAIQTDATVNFGNSGGALVNKSGEFVGVIVSKYIGTGVEGVGFAVPYDEINAVMARLKAGEFIEMPFASGDTNVTKFESRKYFYSFSYPSSWKVGRDQEDQLLIQGSGTFILARVFLAGGAENVADLGALVKLVNDKAKQTYPDFKVVSNKLVSHGLTGVELTFDYTYQGESYRGVAFVAQSLTGGRGQLMGYVIEVDTARAALKKQNANVQAFLNSLNVVP